MKLRGVSLTNVRRFGAQTATLEGIGDGITVICEANEFGKSTFFDALHALFFERFGATTRAVRSLQPRAGGAVKVAAEIETASGRFRVEKRWLSQKSAAIREADGGRLIASDGEAEAWLSAQIGEGRDGPAGLLWVRQGVFGLEPEGNTSAEKAEQARLTETRRDLLSSVAGEIDAMTGGKGMDRVLRRCAEDLAALTTPTGRPSGVWKAANDAVAALEQEHAGLELQCRALAEALRERAAVTRERAEHDAPEARAHRENDLARAEENARRAEDHAETLRGAELAARVAALEHETAREALDRHLAADRALAEATRAFSQAEAESVEAARAAHQASDEAAMAHTAHDEAAAALAALRQALATAHRRDGTVARAARAADLASRLQHAEAERGTEEAARARLEVNTATRAALERAEKAASDVERLGAAVAAGAPRLRISYDGEVRVLRDAAPLDGDTDLPLGAADRFDLPGIGRMTLHLPAQAAQARAGRDLDAARDALAAALSACGADTLAAARSRGREREEETERARLAAARLAVIAPEGLPALRAEAQAAAAAREVTGEAEQRPVGELDSAVEAAERRTGEAGAILAAAERRREAARAEASGAAATLRDRISAREQAASAAGAETDRETRRAGLARSLTQAETRRDDAAAAVVGLRADAPDLLSARANLKRAEDAGRAAAARRAHLTERLAGLSATIEAKAEQGVEERRDDLAGQLELARTTAARVANRAAALSRLKAVLEETRSAAREAYFGPIHDELAPLLRLLHDDAALSFDTDRLLPEALRRGGEDETLDSLSGGTREQVAILTRLAFARLFARQGRPMPIILDDALVFSDDSRIVKMFTALNRVAADQQIIVFSCRQLAFQSLGGDRPAVRVTEAAT